MKFCLEKVHFMPKVLKPGVLYLSDEFGTAAHLCACGCGAKVRTPIGPTEWSIKEQTSGPTLWPSIGNWQRPCRSHYVIERGEVVWAPAWSDAQVRAGRANEQRLRENHFAQLDRGRQGWLNRCIAWIKNIFE
jgi:hypothetical protein